MLNKKNRSKFSLIIFAIFLGLFFINTVTYLPVAAEEQQYSVTVTLTKIYAAHSHDNDNSGRFKAYVRFFVDGSYTKWYGGKWHKIKNCPDSRDVTDTIVDGIKIDSDDKIQVKMEEWDFIGNDLIIYSQGFTNPCKDDPRTFYEFEDEQGCYMTISFIISEI